MRGRRTHIHVCSCTRACTYAYTHACTHTGMHAYNAYRSVMGGRRLWRPHSRCERSHSLVSISMQTGSGPWALPLLLLRCSRTVRSSRFRYDGTRSSAQAALHRSPPRCSRTLFCRGSILVGVRWGRRGRHLSVRPWRALGLGLGLGLGLRLGLGLGLGLQLV